MSILSTHFNMRVLFAVCALVMMENMLRLDATDPPRSSTSSVDKRYAFFKMRVLTLLAIFTFAAFASAPMEGISLLVLIRVWDIASRTIRNTFSGHEQDIYSLDFARDGRTIASGSGDRTVRLWDINEGQNILTLSIEDGVTTVAISPDTKLVAAGSLDKSVRVWDASSGYLVERLEGPDGHKDSVYSVAFAPNGKDLVSGSLDKTIKMWELVAPRGGHPNNAPKGGRCIRTFEGHKVCATTTSSKMLHLTLFRILFFLLLLLLMETGFFPDLKTVVSNSGTLEPVTHSLCCKVTRIASFQLHQVQAAARSLPVVEI
jgi:WD40 repeat protein